MFIGFVSLFFNWTAAQYGGHQALTQYDLDQKKFIIGKDFIVNGPSSSIIRTLTGIFGINSWILNLSGLLLLALAVYMIWKKRR